MNHVLKLLIIIKTKNQRHEEKGWSCNLVCEEITSSKLIPYCLFFIFILNII
jgi:hypothetical protein